MCAQGVALMQISTFAASVAGHLGDGRYAEPLRKLVRDNTPLPQGWFDETVAARARTALAWLTTHQSRARDDEEFRKVIDEMTAHPFQR